MFASQSVRKSQKDLVAYLGGRKNGFGETGERVGTKTTHAIKFKARFRFQDQSARSKLQPISRRHIDSSSCQSAHQKYFLHIFDQAGAQRKSSSEEE